VESRIVSSARNGNLAIKNTYILDCCDDAPIEQLPPGQRAILKLEGI